MGERVVLVVFELSGMVVYEYYQLGFMRYYPLEGSQVGVLWEPFFRSTIFHVLSFRGRKIEVESNVTDARDKTRSRLRQVSLDLSLGTKPRLLLSLNEEEWESNCD